VPYVGHSGTGSGLLPFCGVPEPSGKKPFLNVSVGIEADKHHPFVFGFNASGTFADANLQAVRDQFTDKVYSEVDLRDKQRYWTEDEALKALQSTNPKYEPDH
jgi:hypothetical protein